MISRTSVCVLCVVIFALSISAQEYQTQSPSTSNASNWKAISDANYLSAFSIFKKITRHLGNVVYSPLSLNSVMSMAYLGADGQTANEIKQVFHYPDDEEVLCTGSKELLWRIKNASDLTLQIASRMYVGKRCPISVSYQTKAQHCMNSRAEAIDFEDTRKAAEDINVWVENNTNHKIKDFLSPEQLDKRSALVLLNAVHFKGAWDKPFDPIRTQYKYFFVNDSYTIKEVPYMKAKDYFRTGYVREIKSQILEVPYKGKDVAMLFITPDHRHLDRVLNKLPTLSMDALRGNLGPGDFYVDVEIPRFTVETTIELKRPFKKLGIRDMFTWNANFRKISNTTMKVNRVFQKAFIDVNEEGSEASAASGAHFFYTSFPDSITLNHPFIFVIHQTSTNAILFAGKITHPNSRSQSSDEHGVEPEPEPKPEREPKRDSTFKRVLILPHDIGRSGTTKPEREPKHNSTSKGLLFLEHDIGRSRTTYPRDRWFPDMELET